MFRDIVLVVCILSSISSCFSGWNLYRNIQKTISVHGKLKLVGLIECCKYTFYFFFMLSLLAWGISYLIEAPMTLRIIFISISFFDGPISILILQLFEEWLKRKLKSSN